MHQKTFLLGFILIIVSFIFFAYQMASGTPNNTTFLISIGMMMTGGILLAVSKATKFATENGTSIIDELINMVNKSPNPASLAKSIPPEEKAIKISSFRKLLIENELEKCLNQMQKLFQQESNKDGLREVNILQRRLKDNDQNFYAQKITQEDMSIEKIKISYAIIYLIEAEIEAN